MTDQPAATDPKPDVIIPRWEWRTFAADPADLGDAVAVFDGLATSEPLLSDEVYILPGGDGLAATRRSTASSRCAAASSISSDSRRPTRTGWSAGSRSSRPGSR